LSPPYQNSSLEIVDPFNPSDDSGEYISSPSNVVEDDESDNFDVAVSSEAAVELIAKDARRYLSQDGYLLQIGSKQDDIGQATCRLIALDGSYDSTIKISTTHQSLFDYSLHETYMPFEVQLHTKEKKAQFTVQKTNYILNFNEKTYEVKIKYRDADLSESDLLAQNFDKSLSVYLTDLYTAGDAFRGDYVVQNEITKEIWRLSTFDGNGIVLFCSADTVLICSKYEASLLDAYTGNLLEKSPIFNTVSSDENPFIVVGAYYDDKRNIILIAYRNDTSVNANQWDKPVDSVYIAVYSQDGELIDKIDTELYMAPWWFGVTQNYIRFEPINTYEYMLFTYIHEFDQEMALGAIVTR
jgi:hypothetical protein